MKNTILIADNSLINRTFLCGILRDEYEILEAGDGAEALEIMHERAEDISAVLLDLMMPVKSGYQVLAEKQTSPDIQSIPVIVVTAGAETSTELRALNAGAVDFLSKPVEPEIAKRRLRLAIDQRELEELHIRARILEERQYAADHDALTGIYSQSAFFRETQAMVEANPHKAYLLIRWDIEKFKLVNALFGTDVGDQVLREAAASCERHFHGKGTYGRYGSDHFVACSALAEEEAERLLACVADDMRRVANDVGLSQTLVVAAGVYPLTEPGMPVEVMCDRAGMALRTVKGDYNRHVAYYDDELRRRLLEEQDILDNMDAALDHGEFEVYLQPVYDMRTERPVSAEALVRWNRPGRGIVSPGTFIPLFERNGFISKLDAVMWRQVCAILNEREAAGLPELPISVNLSRKSLYSLHVYEDIVQITEQYHIKPELFRIEVTESAYMDNSEQLVETIAKLQEHGFPVLMDDFGSGYSSLNTLREIPVDMLKLDMKFMEGFERGGRVGTILSSVLRMAKWLGIPVIAEGVETVEQYEFLRSIGCEYTQGFYFAKPMPRAEFENFVNSNPVPQHPERYVLSTADISDLMGGNRTLERVFEGMFDALAIYEVSEDRIELVRANEGYLTLFGAHDGMFGIGEGKAEALMTGESVERMRSFVGASVRDSSQRVWPIAWPEPDGGTRALEAHALTSIATGPSSILLIEGYRDLGKIGQG